MKRFFYFACLLLMANTTFAQLDKNTWLVGGSGSFYLSKRDYVSYVSPTLNGYSNELNLTMSPNIGYFLIDKFAIGLRPYFSWGKGESTSANGTISTSDSKRYGIGPFARYYFLDKDKRYNILADISYQLGEWNLGNKGRLTNFSVSTGTVVYFNTSVGIEFLLGYSSQSEELGGLSKNSSKGFNASIGFQIHLIK